MVGVGVLAMGIVSSAYAIGPGGYLGVEAGKTFTNNLPVSLQTTNTPVTPAVPLGSETVRPTNSGVGGRIFFGYNVTQYWGFEGGFTHYALTSYTVPARPYLAIGNPVGDPAISTNGFDFDGKAMFSIPYIGIGAFIRAGFAIIKVGKAGTLITTAQTIAPYTAQNIVGARANTYLRPTLGIGFTYDFNQNWQMRLGASRVFGGGGMESADLVGLGISYHFVDKYCGQFLC